MSNDNNSEKATNPQRSIFDDPVDLFNFNQIQPIQSPSLSYAKLIQASRSQPGSRRNSNDDHGLDLLLGSKLSLNDSESGFRKLPFTMTPQEHIGTFSQRSLDEPEIPSFNPLLSQANESPIRNIPSNSELFPTSSTSNTVSPNTSWIPYHANESGQMIHGDMMDNTRRYSYGWHTPTHRVMTPRSSIKHQTNQDLSQVMCQQFQQFGFCPRNDICPFAHNSTPFFSSTTGSLYQQYNQQQQKPVGFFSPKKKPVRSTTDQQDRFSDSNIEDFIGKLYDLCKDQNGCRFLQKKIEEKEHGDKNLEIVFNEIHSHFTELMTDPFGNYLCQKMLEKCNHEQRTVIVETVAPELVKIALNMHGTRAVQKLIEYLSTPQQANLNGNHVIQKCLYRLSAENNQFIYDAVCANCIQVATHKHGCCVLQRCFDHATIPQKDQLVNEIARHALPLVQNAFGNYVVQYVLELGVSRYSESIIRRFVNHVCILSVQKFSSNVIENCIRTAQPPTRRLLIAELVNQSVMEKLLHDSFANYVVQTSLDFAEEDQRAELVECIRPLLPTIRTTPYGKRIHSKIFRDTKSNGCNKAQFTQQRQRQRQFNNFGNLDEPPQQQNHHHESSYQ